MKKSEAAIHILPEKDMPRYVHEEIKQEPRKMKAKREEEVDPESSLRKKRVKKEERSHSTVVLTEAYDKLSILNEAYKQELIARDIDTMAIKANIEKKITEWKQGREKKDEEAILEGRVAMNIEALQRESDMLWARLAAQIICEGREWKKLRLKLDIDDPEYLLYFGDNDVPLIEWKY
ncbi:uncharacterized protein A4U43_C05F18460 [Asparagus officinalis]|uniref:Uncharacterized protein n=1 Tax=Asparagus officinalis TaxID=4686 RepID=A0A5P1EWY9_ASPOF|nr:uncharacterized protein A4U43_C05F18460 [Asparagus officinalis]